MAEIAQNALSLE